MAEGRLVTGVLRVNKKNRSDAYVSTDGLLDAEIFICGSKDRNRALEGDLVAVELLDVDEVWNAKKEKEEKKKRKDAMSSVDDPRNEGSGSGLRRRGSLKQRPTQKKNDDIEVEGQSLLLVEEEALTDEIKPLYAGHVMAIIDRIPGQMFSGTLGLLRPSSQATKDKQDAERKEKGEAHATNTRQERPKIVWFKPIDKRVPLIAIPTEQTPHDFVENHENYTDQVFVASIKRWPITSLHPFGTLVELLGPGTDLNIEIDAILRDNNFGADVFSKPLLSLLQQTDYKTFPEEVLEGRRNFENEFVTVIPSKAGLAEEAFHVKTLDKNLIELGVHVVDINYHVKKNSPLDREANKRGTSVFLMEREYNMFPKEFNEDVSFKAGAQGLAVSVLFQIDVTTFEVTNTWIGESVITPKAVLSHNDVLQTLSSETSGTGSEEAHLVKTLKSVSDAFFVKRLSLPKTSDELPILGLLDFIDDEPVNVSSNIFEGSVVQRMISEINIQVNLTIAKELHENLQDLAFLRRHSDPARLKLESFIESAKNLNINIDTTSSATIQKSILETKDEYLRKGLEALLYKCMNRARYFVAGKVDPELQSHYFLNLPVYTHFTSPLRRYADIAVHRQLHSILSKEEYFEDFESLVNLADILNFKKDNGKNAQEQSMHLKVCQDINKRTVATGQLVIDSIVIQVYESAFDVLVPEYGIEKRVHGDQLPLRKAEYDKRTRLLEFFWEDGTDSATFVPADEKNPKIITRADSLRKNRSRASSAATAYAQGQNLEQFAKLRLNTDTPSLDDVTPASSSPVNRVARTRLTRSDSQKLLAPYLENVITRVDQKTGERVQEIRVLQHVPVLLSAELGSSLNIPCLTVRALNPFTK